MSQLTVSVSLVLLEIYAQYFDVLFAKRNEHASFRCSLEWLLFPVERSKPHRLGE